MRGEGRGEGRERGGGEALIGCGALRGAAPGAASGAAAVRSGRQGDRRHGHALSRQATPHARAARVLPSAPKSPNQPPFGCWGLHRASAASPALQPGLLRLLSAVLPALTPQPPNFGAPRALLWGGEAAPALPRAAGTHP